MHARQRAITAGVFLWTLSASLATCALADEAKKPAENAAAEKPRELVVDPAAEPIPAFRYHLLPPAAQRIRGNAAPIYTRIVHDRNDDWKQRLYEVSDLIDLPFDELPMDKARDTLEFLAPVTDQLSAAARRSECDWEYVTEDRDPLTILLSDAQFMRSYARLLVLKMRFEARSGNVAGAVDALEDNLAFARHVANAPFLVSELIGTAICDLALAEADNVVGQPGAPNLYWAIAALPRPFVPFTNGLETERRLLTMKFPELTDLDRSRTTEEWQRLAFELRKWSAEVQKTETDLRGTVDEILRASKPATAEQLVVARAYLARAIPMSTERVEAMSEAEVEVRYTVALFAEISDDWQRWFFVPFPQSLPGLTGRSEALKAKAEQRQIYPLVSVITPMSGNLLRAPARLERKLARLQAIEALRMHAAVSGKLPATLAEVTVVPVPNDPATGAPFSYSLDGDVAVLDLADEVGMKREHLSMPVRIRLRQQK